MHFVEHSLSPYGLHQDSTWTSPPGFYMESTGTPSSDSLNLAKSKVHLQSTPPGLHVDSMRSGLEVEETGEGLEVDRLWTGGGLHG